MFEWGIVVIIVINFGKSIKEFLIYGLYFKLGIIVYFFKMGMKFWGFCFFLSLEYYNKRGN